MQDPFAGQAILTHRARADAPAPPGAAAWLRSRSARGVYGNPPRKWLIAQDVEQARRVVYQNLLVVNWTSGIPFAFA